MMKSHIMNSNLYSPQMKQKSINMSKTFHQTSMSKREEDAYQREIEFILKRFEKVRSSLRNR